MNINEKIKKRRTELGLSLQNVADALGVHRSTVMRYESADIEKMPIDIIPDLARVLKCSPEYLMGWEEDEEVKNIYGDHAANLEYFKDKPEILEMYKDIYESENLKILFDTARELTPKELEKVLRYMKLVIEEEL